MGQSLPLLLLLVGVQARLGMTWLRALLLATRCCCCCCHGTLLHEQHLLLVSRQHAS
jgi:hypothetical protein